MHKYIRNGMVAVVLSKDYGSGWSTWTPHRDEQLQVLFDPMLVDYILADKFTELEQYVKLRYPDKRNYDVRNLMVHWIKEGTEFIVHEYDGSEDIYEKDKMNWITA